jgi:D-cysteine desulfhydrase
MSISHTARVLATGSALLQKADYLGYATTEFGKKRTRVNREMQKMRKWKYPPRVHLANVPTPIQKLTRISEGFGGPEIYIKRDDLTGCAESGSKIRKLEFLLADAFSKCADTVITCGPLQSNHCRATAVACRSLGIKPYLVLRGEDQKRPEGNYFLDKLLGAKVRFITADEYKHSRNEIMEDVAAQLTKKGKKVYVIPEGGSNSLGMFGYIKCAEEIAKWSRKCAVYFSHIFYAAGSGGVSAGLILGAKLFSLKVKVVGVNVWEAGKEFRDYILAIMLEAVSKYRLPVRVSESDITLLENYDAGGYGRITPELTDIIRLFATTEGIILDPVYTAKAACGLKSEIHKGNLRKRDKILFVHTGGIFGLFPFWNHFR